jgi:hypothetical protein
VAVEYDSAFEPHFSAPTQVPPIVPSGGTVDFNVPLTCAPGTSPGDHVVNFRLRPVDGSQVLGSLQFNVTVTRTVSVATNLPSRFTMLPGDNVRGELRVTLSGGPAQLEVAHGPLPPGITMRPDDQHLSMDGTIVVGFDIDVHPNATLGARPPLQLFWTATEPEIKGEFDFTIDVADIEEIVYDSGPLEAGTVRGWAQLAVHRNGDWFFRGHVHENGFVGDNYAFAIALKPIEADADLHYAVQHGTLGGTVDPFDKRDEDWQQPTGNDPVIAQNWNLIRQRGSSAFRSVLHVSTDPLQVLEAVLDTLAIGVAIAAGAVVVGFLTSPTTKCDNPTWTVGPGDENEGVKEADPGGGIKVRCEGP